MRIETIKLKNYRSFHDLYLTNLPDLAIFVGANGTGKSTLFDVFAFLRDALTNNIKQALGLRGGFLEVRSRGKEDENIEIELQFRLEIVGKERLVTYRIEIGFRQGSPFVAREILRYKRGSYGSPYHFLDFVDGEGYAITNEEDFDRKDEELDREHQKLGAPDILAIKGLGQFEKFKAANAFRVFIENWHVSDFHVSGARKSQDAGYAEHLSSSGENLSLVAQYIYEYHPEIFENILGKMKARVPGVQDVKAETTVDGRMVLRFQDGSFKDPFIARYVSDGTIKMFAYLVLLFDPSPHPLLCVEEPENQLYPSLLLELIDEFRQYASRGGQVFVTSHSPDLVNGAELEEVFWLEKINGYTSVKRASEDQNIKALVKAGEQLGYLWKQGYLSGANPSLV